MWKTGAVTEYMLGITEAAADRRRCGRPSVWIGDGARGPLVVEVQVDDGVSSSHGVVVVLRHGVRVEGLSLADVAALARLLS